MPPKPNRFVSPEAEIKYYRELVDIYRDVNSQLQDEILRQREELADKKKESFFIQFLSQ